MRVEGAGPHRLEYADVLPYFRKLETSWRGEGPFHGGSGPIGITETNVPSLMYDVFEQAALSAGYKRRTDVAIGEHDGVSKIELSVGAGRRQSTSYTYLRQALGRPNLTVRTRALTQRLELERRRATGVRYLRDGEACVAHARREIILSAGSYQSPQLLMLSGIVPAEHLQSVRVPVLHDLPGVGQNLNEHPDFFMQYKAAGTRTFLNHLRFDQAVLGMLRWLVMHNGPFATNATPANVFLRTSNRNSLRPDVQAIFTSIGLDAELWFPGVTKLPVHRFTVAPNLLHPASRGWVKLRSADPAAPPRIFFNIYDERSDLDCMIEALERVREIFATAPLAGQVAAELKPGPEVRSRADIEAWLRNNTIINQHPLGTCKMGVDDAAVSMASCACAGSKGCVVDGSVMPNEPGGNPNIAVIESPKRRPILIRGRRLPPSEVDWHLAGAARNDFADLGGRRVLVTGASSGIGAALARGFAACGALVGVHYNSNAAGAKRVAAEIAEAGGRCELMHAELAEPGAPPCWRVTPRRGWAGSTCSSTMPAVCSRACSSRTSTKRISIR